jgi:hypothetical protein
LAVLGIVQAWRREKADAEDIHEPYGSPGQARACYATWPGFEARAQDKITTQFIWSPAHRCRRAGP